MKFLAIPCSLCNLSVLPANSPLTLQFPCAPCTYRHFLSCIICALVDQKIAGLTTITYITLPLLPDQWRCLAACFMRGDSLILKPPALLVLPTKSSTLIQTLAFGWWILWSWSIFCDGDKKQGQPSPLMKTWTI